MSKYTFTLPSPGGSGGFDPIDNVLTAGASDAELVYTGDDPIVWDRINSTRLRRGLPGLTQLGFPRPMSGATVTAAGVQSFTIEGPPGLTQAQAQQIFQQQNTAGSLVGLKSGDVINSATQAAGGLSTAIGQVSQGAAGIGGGPLGALTGVLNSATQSASVLGASILGGVNSTAKTILSGITNVVQNTPVTDAINTANFALQTPGVGSIPGLSDVDVRAGMAQASKLVGQGADAISNTLGAGKFGMDATQLEAAGLLKAGTSNLLAQGANTLTSVLSSPAVWTGKNGVGNLDSFLGSAAKQDLAFESLMSTGLASLKSLGAPLAARSATSLTGVALTAAKSVEGTLEWAKGAALPSGVKSAFDTAARDGAFAAEFASTKLNGAMLQEIPAAPAIATCSRATVDAASTRVVGNDKVPEVSYAAPVPELSEGELNRRFGNGISYVERITSDALAAAAVANRAIKDGNLGAAYDAIRTLEQAEADLSAAAGKFLERQRNAENLDPPATGLASQFSSLRAETENFIKTIQETVAKLRERAAAAVTP